METYGMLALTLIYGTIAVVGLVGRRAARLEDERTTAPATEVERTAAK